MEGLNLIIFKLNYAGKYEQVDFSGGDPLDLFSVVSILAIYIPRQKRMYMWMGSNVSRSLRNYIGHFRADFSNEYPDYRVVRNITVECKNEPPDFWDTTGLSKEKLSEKIKYQEEKLLPVISEIKDLKSKQDDSFEEENYEDAIQIASKILELAKDIDDKHLIQDQSDFIEEAKRRDRERTFLANLQGDFEDLKTKAEAANEPQSIREFHVKASEFKEKYSEGEIPLKEIEGIKELLEKEDEIWKEYEKKYKQLLETIVASEDKVKKALDDNDLIKASEVLEETKEPLEKIFEEDIIKKWEELQNQYQEQYNDILKKIQDLEAQLQEAINNQHRNAIINYAEKLVSIAEKHQKEDIKEKYSAILKQTRESMEQKEEEKRKERDKLMEAAKKLNDIIETDENVLPLVEEFTASDILGDLSDDINEMMNQIGSLLTDHRVEIKNDIKNKAVMTSSSGEVIELEKSTHVEEVEKEKEKTCFVQSGLENPFEDAIEEAIITDLIPYNFEISRVELNDKPAELPDKTLTKEGIELTWKLNDIPPKEKININYNLRRRISRTVIFILEGKVKIIKTHSNLSDQIIEGLYEAKMPFTNNFQSLIEGLVVEDIIPLYYLNLVKAPTELLPEKVTDSKTGELIKWNVGLLERPKTVEYHYKLLELYKLEEIKVKIHEFNRESKELLSKGRLSELYEKNEEIIQALEEYY